MNFGIAGKTALVTGGSRGLGNACAIALGEEGCRVIVLARDEADVDRAVKDLIDRGIDAHGVVSDLRDKERLTSALRAINEEFGVPDIFVYNNGGAGDMYFDQASDDDFEEAYRVYVMGFAWCMRELLEPMKAKGWSRIVTLGSLCAKEPHKGYPMIMHNMGRAAQVGMNKTLSNMVGDNGMTMNIIGTGMIDHDGGSIARAYEAHSFDMGMSREDIQKYRTKDIPVGHMGTREDIGAMCAFLCSNRAGFINGQTMLVDGGRVASLF